MLHCFAGIKRRWYSKCRHLSAEPSDNGVSLDSMGTVENGRLSICSFLSDTPCHDGTTESNLRCSTSTASTEPRRCCLTNFTESGSNVTEVTNDGDNEQVYMQCFRRTMGIAGNNDQFINASVRGRLSQSGSSTYDEYNTHGPLLDNDTGIQYSELQGQPVVEPVGSCGQWGVWNNFRYADDTSMETQATGGSDHDTSGRCTQSSSGRPPTPQLSVSGTMDLRADTCMDQDIRAEASMDLNLRADESLDMRNGLGATSIADEYSTNDMSSGNLNLHGPTSINIGDYDLTEDFSNSENLSGANHSSIGDSINNISIPSSNFPSERYPTDVAPSQITPSELGVQVMSNYQGNYQS